MCKCEQYYAFTYLCFLLSMWRCEVAIVTALEQHMGIKIAFMCIIHNIRKGHKYVHSVHIRSQICIYILYAHISSYTCQYASIQYWQVWTIRSMCPYNYLLCIPTYTKAYIHKSLYHYHSKMICEIQRYTVLSNSTEHMCNTLCFSVSEPV